MGRLRRGRGTGADVAAAVDELGRRGVRDVVVPARSRSRPPVPRSGPRTLLVHNRPGLRRLEVLAWGAVKVGGRDPAGAGADGPAFGFQIPDFRAIVGDDPRSTMARLRDVVAAVEDSGFRSLWIMDHFQQVDDGRAGEPAAGGHDHAGRPGRLHRPGAASGSSCAGSTSATRRCSPSR